MRKLNVAMVIVAVFALASAMPASACINCSFDVVWWCKATAAGGDLCRTTANGCAVSGACTGGGTSKITVGRLGLFQVQLDGGSLANFPAATAASDPTLSEIRAEIASRAGVPLSAVTLRGGAVEVSGIGLDPGTDGLAVSSTRGFLLRRDDVDGSGVRVRACTFVPNGTPTLNLDSEIPEAGGLVLFTTTVGTSTFVIASFERTFDSDDWALDAEDIQVAFWADYQNTVGTPSYALGEVSAASICQ